MIDRAQRLILALAIVVSASPQAAAQSPRPLMPIQFENSAEFGWLKKPVMARRTLDDMTSPATWTFTGTGALSFPQQPRLGMRVLRVDMQMFRETPAPTRNKLSSINLRRLFDNGYAGLNWPVEYGGRDLPASQQLLFLEETTRARGMTKAWMNCNACTPRLIASA